MPKRIKQRILIKIILILTIAIIYILLPLFIKFYGKYGSKKIADEFSPGKRYKVEYYILLDHKSILYPVDNPFFVKIYDFKEKNIFLRAMFMKWAKGQVYLGHKEVSLTL